MWLMCKHKTTILLQNDKISIIKLVPTIFQAFVQGTDWNLSPTNAIWHQLTLNAKALRV